MKDDGPAFPISLRDLIAILSMVAGKIGGQYFGHDPTHASKSAYETADAMLAERDK